MRFLPFAKGKKGFQFAGGGVSDSGGGGGGYVLPPANSSTLGGVKIGSGVEVTSDGTISVSGGDNTISLIAPVDTTTTVNLPPQAIGTIVVGGGYSNAPFDIYNFLSDPNSVYTLYKTVNNNVPGTLSINGLVLSIKPTHSALVIKITFSNPSI